MTSSDQLIIKAFIIARLMETSMEATCSADVCKARVKLHKDVIELAVGGSEIRPRADWADSPI